MKYQILSYLLLAAPCTTTALFPHKLINLSTSKPLSSNTQDDILDGLTPCRALTVLFAADSSEYGNVGTHSGPSFFQALASKVGGREEIALQGIDYPVDYHVYENEDEWEYWEERDKEGPEMMIKFAEKVMEQCPLTHLVLGGYGQGALVVHDAASSMRKSILDFVRAVVVFGEGNHSKRLGYGANGKTHSKIKTYCSGSDPFCLGKEAIGDMRLTYTKEPALAARFVLDRIIGRR